MTEKKPHAGAALAFGLFGILIALVCGVLFGWIGGSVAFLFGLIAFGLGRQSRKRTDKVKGKGGIATGVIAILFAVGVSLTLIFGADKIGEIAEQRGFPLIAKHVRALSEGIVGLMMEIDKENDRLAKAHEELQELKKK